jgi:hypothetical protein
MEKVDAESFTVLFYFSCSWMEKRLVVWYYFVGEYQILDTVKSVRILGITEGFFFFFFLDASTCVCLPYSLFTLPRFWSGFGSSWNWLFIAILQCDLLDMPAVGQLEKDAKYALAYQLLKIFLTQRLDAYLEFHAANSTLLKSYGKNSALCKLDELSFIKLRLT